MDVIDQGFHVGVAVGEFFGIQLPVAVVFCQPSSRVTQVKPSFLAVGSVS